MMTLRRGLMVVAWAWTAFAVGACRPPEPTPTQNTDLGTDNDILLPPPAAWHDKSIARGQAEWKPFRKPGDAAKPEASAGGTAGQGATPSAADGAVEKEIRDLVDEFNGLVKEGKYKEALDYLTDDQALIAEQVVEVIPQYAKVLKELSEVAPACREHIDRAISTITVPKFLFFQVVDLEITGEREVTGIVPDPETHRPFVDEASFKVRFIRDDDGYWLIESGHIAALPEIVSAMQSSLETLPTFADDIRSGRVAAPEIESRCEAAKKPLDKLARLMGGASSAAPEKTDAPTTKRPDVEPPPEETPPEAKKPVTGG